MQNTSKTNYIIIGLIIFSFIFQAGLLGFYVSSYSKLQTKITQLEQAISSNSSTVPTGTLSPLPSQSETPAPTFDIDTLIPNTFPGIINTIHTSSICMTILGDNLCTSDDKAHLSMDPDGTLNIYTYIGCYQNLSIDELQQTPTKTIITLKKGNIMALCGSEFIKISIQFKNPVPLSNIQVILTDFNGEDREEILAE